MKSVTLSAVGQLLVAGLVRAGDGKPAGGFEVEVVKDVPYVEGKDADPVRHRLDLYRPKGKTHYPVLVFVHGGG
jgi:acetyl esterase/lipase